MKNTLAYVLAGIALSPFALNAFADHHEGHSATANTNEQTTTTKELRANTTDKHGKKIEHKVHRKYMKDNKKVGLKPLSPADSKEMINREKTASPPAEDLSDKPAIN